MRTPVGLSRTLAAGLLALLAPAGLLATAPATSAADRAAADRAAVTPATSLRAALVAGAGDADALPRGRTLRGTARTSPALRTATAPVGTAALTATRVSRIEVHFVDTAGNAWSAPARAAFRAAADVWERTIESPVPIVVQATARSLGPGILGGAGPFDFLRNQGATVAPAGRAPTVAQLRDDVFEPVALTNARTGRDARPRRGSALNPDIVAEFNPNGPGLYLGTDGRPAPHQIDFRTVVLHEIGHGLGIAGTARLDGGRATVGSTAVNGRTGVRSATSFDQFTYVTSAAEAGTGGRPVLSLPDGSAALRSALVGDSLYWSGQTALTAAGAKVRLQAPARCGEPGPLRRCGPGESPFVEGSSYSHLDERRYPRASAQALMTPYLDTGEAYADPGQIALGMLADMGYSVPALTGSRFTAVDPVRLLDTRSGRGAAARAVGAGGALDLQVTGRAGVPAGATAVVLNLTGVSPTLSTHVRVYPTPVTPSPVPGVSNLNLAAGVSRANLVTVPIGNRGRVRLRNASGAVHLVADLAGWYAPRAASTFRAVDPVRLLDTRRRGAGAPVPSGGVLDVRVAGAGPVPSGATAVALTLTAVGATAPTSVRAYPGGGPAAAVPLVSNVNASSSAPVGNLVVVRVGADGTVRLRSVGGSTHLVADVSGYYSGDPAGDLFRVVTPRRVLDTRVRLGTAAGAPTRLGPGQSVVLSAGGGTTIPRRASAAVLNVTGVGATARTAVRVYPATASAVPPFANLELVAGATSAGLVVARLGGGQLRLQNTAGTLGLVADAAGWFGPAR